MWMSHALAHRRIDAYFEGRLGPASEARMRRHLGRCADCRARYERHLVAEAALPDGERRGEDRGWQGILAAAQVPAARPRRGLVPALVLAGAAALVVIVPLARRPSEPVERGGPAGTALGSPAVHLFRSLPGGKAAPVTDRIGAGDGWLIAYSNPGTDARWLMVFAVDDACAVHWFHPAYEHAGENPAAVPIRTGENGVELGEEIRHQLGPGRLRVFGLFLREPLKVLVVEDVVRARCQEAAPAAPASPCAPLGVAAVHQACQPLVVDP
jgi:hypothetical protein